MADCRGEQRGSARIIDIGKAKTISVDAIQRGLVALSVGLFSVLFID
jgi:hypothetical protein